MHISFEALLGIFNSLILRLDEFFPFDHLENSDIFFPRAYPAPNNLSCQKYGTQTTQKSPPRGEQFYWSPTPNGEFQAK